MRTRVEDPRSTFGNSPVLTIARDSGKLALYRSAKRDWYGVYRPPDKEFRSNLLQSAGGGRLIISVRSACRHAVRTISSPRDSFSRSIQRVVSEDPLSSFLLIVPRHVPTQSVWFMAHPVPCGIGDTREFPAYSWILLKRRNSP